MICPLHDREITGDWCPECARVVEELIASARPERTIPVGVAATAEIERLRAEVRQLRIGRDNAREMEAVHGDNWEAAQAEVKRLTAARVPHDGQMWQHDRCPCPRCEIARLESELADERAAHAETRGAASRLIADLSEYIQAAAPSGSAWDEAGGLADRVDEWEARRG